MKRVLPSLMLIYCTFCAASLPIGCFEKGFEFKDDQLILSSKQAIYVLKNKNSYPIYIDVEQEDPGAHAGWLSQVEANQYSAILVSGDLPLVCFEKRPGSELKISCDYVLEPCLMNDAVLDKVEKGSNAWLVENKAYPELVDKLKRRNLLKP